MTTNDHLGPILGYTRTPCAELSPHQEHGEGDHQSGWWCPGVPGHAAETAENIPLNDLIGRGECPRDPGEHS
jgi:hypothetical protein